MSSQSALIKVMTDAARKAGRALARDFGEVAELQVSKKGAADYVTAADIKAEQTLFEELLRARPGYGFLGEERGMIDGTDKTHTWIVYPLDGTTNFLHAMPHFAINIALQREGGIVAAVTYNPATSDLFWAERGRGAYLNDRRLRVAARVRFEEAFDVQHFALQRQGKSNVRHFVESQPCDRMRQGDYGRFRPFRRRGGNAQHIHGEHRVGVDDVGELLSVGRFLRPCTHHAHGHFRQHGHGEFIARQAAFQ